MDRRRSNRFDLRTPVSFLWKGLDGIRHRGEGLVRDISELGIFVFADGPPPAGSTVQFEVCFPSTSVKRAEIRARGRVVRVETVDESRAQFGFAAATQTLKFFDHRTDGRSPGSMPTRVREPRKVRSAKLQDNLHPARLRRWKASRI